jgi:DNA-binding winged helix-turn-helix (wHTH) protein
MDAEAEDVYLLTHSGKQESELACVSEGRGNSDYPFLDVRAPDGKEYTIDFKDIFEQSPEQTRLTMGRSDVNDIVLPDPHKKVSRQQCILEREGDRWWLIDEGSANGTFLSQGGSGSESDLIDVRAAERMLLQDGDAILMLGKLTATSQPVFWKLTFRDPNVTERVDKFQPAELEYDFSEQKLFKVTRQRRQEVKLSPQELILINYMAQRNRDNDNQPSVCGYEELIKTIWPENFGHDRYDINRLVWSVREKIERDSGEPQFLKTVRGQGYLLNVRMQ